MPNWDDRHQKCCLQWKEFKGYKCNCLTVKSKSSFTPKYKTEYEMQRTMGASEEKIFLDIGMK